ncbi:HET domain-containing protein [Colletotrichum paranaense]|uniref:HET domain-containing protein n=1 Tax=Colletotrichum paranaense TaxID=1914294 RepID=A0ABQ9SKH8_9PEZI|nr:HET domain-containing protein [Colletotrichum paranaense]KAK1537972.1 HET domain-containing protein [Colletotrichum paranaense]
MKLLNCSSLLIEEFSGLSIPESYAILSHRWEADHQEATYQDFGKPDVIARKKGWKKIQHFCRLALQQGYKYAWVDTCCINKQDFTELTEAINSMFKWYARSSICYAYLSDVGIDGVSLQHSQWFTRGWTLQELIAPSRVEFFDKDWNYIGSRSDLCDIIQQRTNIDKSILVAGSGRVEGLLTTIPVARRMSWASGRMTKREEDLAYCLLGVFGVKMPLLSSDQGRRHLGILLRDQGGNVFLRWKTGRLWSLEHSAPGIKHTMFISKFLEPDVAETLVGDMDSIYRNAFCFPPTPPGVEFVKAQPDGMWSSSRRMFITQGLDTFDGFVQYRTSGAADQNFIVACGFTGGGANPWVCLAANKNETKHIFQTAMSGDLMKLRKLGSERGVMKTKITFGMSRRVEDRPVVLSLGMETRMLEGQPVFSIFVDQRTDWGDLCSVM